MGGSIAGCAGALAVTRAGAGEVVVFERAGERLADQGVGLAVHADRYAELAAAGYLDGAMPWVRLTRRPWVVRDGERRAGREIGELPFPFRSYSWGSLWRELRGRLPQSVDFRLGVGVTAVEPAADGARLRLSDGTEERFDLVIGADGYRSRVRAALDPTAVAEFGGFLAWRGTLPVAELPEPAGAFAETDATSVGFPGGHLIAYRIPGRDGTGTVVNWVFYSAPPAAAAQRFADPASTHPKAIPEDLVQHQRELVERHFPPFWQEVIGRTADAERLLQPMYDMSAPRFAGGRLALLGDAASIARPTTGSGAVKALQDAVALERALRAHQELPAALAAYSADRAPLGRATVQLGRSLGQAMVLGTPEWAGMDQAALDAWWREAEGGHGSAFGGHRLGRS
ncbi:FAD-dependent monooxygenase [Kitasatospora viridis]|uniref:FAD-dependent monooxygenase n=1 Tax=Kitasatospora viridis TaxID=281105 RepID=UPI001FE877CB|nr:FAD-dependent monooxygenase [Kitasatospora viridis]